MAIAAFSLSSISSQVTNLLKFHKVSTVGGKLLDIGANIAEVSICCHSDTPVSTSCNSASDTKLI
jgi:lactam utilization protein B